MATSEEVRNAAQGERDRLRDVIAAADLTLFTIAAIAVSSTRTFGLLGLVPALMRWRAQKELVVQERLVEDPPRFDFRKQARIDHESWERSASFEELEDGGVLFLYVSESQDIVTWETAMIDAIERQLGASEAGELEYVERRGLEAEHLGDAAASALQSSARRLIELLPDGRPAFKKVAEGDLETIRGVNSGLQEPRQDQLAALIDLGVPEEGLFGLALSANLPRRAVDQPLEFFEMSVRANSASKRRLAEVLQSGMLLGVS